MGAVELGQAQPHQYSAEVKHQLNKEKMQIKEESARARIHMIKWSLWKWWRNRMTSCVMPRFQGFRLTPMAWSLSPVCLVQTQINFKMKENQPILLILSCGKKSSEGVCTYNRWKSNLWSADYFNYSQKSMQGASFSQIVSILIFNFVVIKILECLCLAERITSCLVCYVSWDTK